MEAFYENDMNEPHLRRESIKSSENGIIFSRNVCKVYACGKDYLEVVDFSKFLADFPEIPKALLGFMNECEWKDLSTQNQILNDFYFYDEITCLSRDIPICAFIRQNLLVMYSDLTFSTILDLFYLPEAFLNIENLSVCIYKLSGNKSKVTFRVASQEKLRLWISELEKRTKIINFSELYEMKELIGYGTYSQVFKGIDIHNSVSYAVKVFEKCHQENHQKQLVFNEVRVLSSIDHKNIIKIHDFIQTQTHVYIVEELVEGQPLQNLYLFLSEAEIKIVIKEVLETVQYLHSVGVIHRDIKMENIIVDKKEDSLKIKLIDFGFAEFKLPKTTFNSYCGTVAYMAPEFHLNTRYDESIDVWSIGILVYALIAKELPFRGYSDKEVVYRVQGASPDYTRLSDPAKSFTEKMLNKSPDLRPTASQALEHFWLLRHEVAN